MDTTTSSHDEGTGVELFDTAVQALLSPIHQSTTKEAIEQAGSRRTQSIAEMQMYMRRIGLTPTTDYTPSIIHVTGTKGKGSVCAMCESILRHVQPKCITGLFTSPHLMDIRERIRINGRPVSQQIFGQAYWHIRRKLEMYDTPPLDNSKNSKNENKNDAEQLPVLPGYFRMLTLMALYIFHHYRNEDGVPITFIILEVGMGGRYDATNSWPPPPSVTATNNNNSTLLPSQVRVKQQPQAICGVTLIDYDHVRVLGSTLPEIAWEKGGIYQIDKGSVQHLTPHPVREREAYERCVAEYHQQSSKLLLQQHDARCFALDVNNEAVVQVLQLCAAREGQGCTLQLVGSTKAATTPTTTTTPRRLPEDCSVGLPGIHQRMNAELAIALCDAVLKKKQRQISGDEIRRHTEQLSIDTSINADSYMAKVYQGLANVSWPGRCQTVDLSNAAAVELWAAPRIPRKVMLRLDGAHTIQSVRAGLEWYQGVAARNTALGEEMVFHILCFNCSHERNPVELLELLYSAQFDAVYFCRADSERPSSIQKASATDLLQAAGIVVQEDLLRPADDGATSSDDSCAGMVPTWQDTLHGIWRHLEVESKYAWSAHDTASNLTASEALERTRQTFQDECLNSHTRIEVFVTGSLYLVGSMLTAVQWKEPEVTGTLQTNL